jgi:hypothetical protein
MPSIVRTRFQKRVSDLLRDYGEMLLAVQGKNRRASLESMLSEQAAMSLGVYWEAFVHDLFVAYVTRNPVNCVSDFKRRIEQNLTSKFALSVPWVALRIPSRLTEKQVAKILDPKGWNVNATSARELREKANQFLHSTDARNFALDADDALFVDFLVAVRNYLAHRSANSRTELTAKIRQLDPAGNNAVLSGEPVRAALYLKRRVNTAETRVHSIGHRLADISAKLAP